MRKATIKNIAEIGDVDLLSDDENFSESPKLNKQNTMKLRQDLTVIFGDEQNHDNEIDDDSPNHENKENRKSLLKQDLTVIFGDDYVNQNLNIESNSNKNSNHDRGSNYNNSQKSNKNSSDRYKSDKDGNQKLIKVNFKNVDDS